MAASRLEFNVPVFSCRRGRPWRRRPFPGRSGGSPAPRATRPPEPLDTGGSEGSEETESTGMLHAWPAAVRRRGLEHGPGPRRARPGARGRARPGARGRAGRPGEGPNSATVAVPRDPCGERVLVGPERLPGGRAQPADAGFGPCSSTNSSFAAWTTDGPGARNRAEGRGTRSGPRGGHGPGPLSRLHNTASAGRHKGVLPRESGVGSCPDRI